MKNAIQFRTRIFTEDWSRTASEQVLDILLEALTQIDMLWLRLNPRTPHIYRAGIRYIREQGSEEWCTIPEILNEGGADCEDLCAWLAAFYRVEGIDRGAKCVKRFHDLGGFLLYHILVQRSDGTLEDPSRKLGMNVDEPDGYKPVPGVAWRVSHGMTNVVGAAMQGNGLALAQLDALRQHAENGDARARYLVEIARLIRRSGYDPSQTKWTRLPDGRWGWT